MSEPLPTSPPPATPSVGLGHLLLLAIPNLIWAAQGTAVKKLLESGGETGPHLGPIGITFLPFYVTTLLFVPLLIWRQRRAGPRRWPSGRDWTSFAVAGVCGQVLAQLGMTWGVSLSLASNGAILNLLIPVISAVLASMMLGERLSVLRVACLAIGLAGAALMSVPDLEQAHLLARGYLAGNLLIFAGCTGSSFYNVYCKGLLERYAEIEILIYSYFTASLASLPLLMVAEPHDFEALGALDLEGWLAFGFLAVFMYGVSMLVFFYVLQRVSVTVASASLYLVPLFGVLIAYKMLGEQLSMVSFVGAAVVLVSTIVIMRYDTSGA